MRYIDRDKDGKINGSFARMQYEGQERVADDDPDLMAFNDALKAELEAVEQAGLEKDALVQELKLKVDMLTADVEMLKRDSTR